MEGEGWVNAEDLQVGGEIRSADSPTGAVEAIEIERTSQEMYNLTVDEAHTFFVGDGQWLVHNADLCNPNNLIPLDQLGNSLNPGSDAEAIMINQVVRSGYKDMVTHIPNVYNVADALATEMGYSGSQLRRYRLGVFGHDIGKGFDPYTIAIFRSRAKFIGDERLSLETHVWLGKKMIEEIGVSDPMIVQMVSWHHPDYLLIPNPRNLPEYVQMLSAADVYGAMREVRSYKVDLGHDSAITEVYNKLVDPGYLRPDIYEILKRITMP